MKNFIYNQKQSALEFEKEYQDLLEEMKRLETECEELRNLNSIEDNRYQDVLKAVQESHKDLNSKIAENNDLQKQIIVIEKLLLPN